MVCDGPGTNYCWEPRHPQDFVRGVKDKQTPPWVRPEPPDTFLDLVDTANTADAWTVYGSNTVADNSEEGITITYVDNANGAYVDLNEAGGLSSDLTASTQYIVTFMAQLSGAALNLQAYDGVSEYTSETINPNSNYTPGSITFTAGSTTGCLLRLSGMGSGDVLKLRYISVRVA